MNKRALNEDTPKDTPKDAPKDATRLGKALLACDEELKRMGLPTLHQAIGPLVISFSEAEGCDEETLGPFGEVTMEDVLNMARNEPKKYRAIIDGPAFDESDRKQTTSTLNRMQAALSMTIIAEAIEAAK
jgi:hypothetical protein